MKIIFFVIVIFKSLALQCKLTEPISNHNQDEIQILKENASAEKLIGIAEKDNLNSLSGLLETGLKVEGIEKESTVNEVNLLKSGGQNLKMETMVKNAVISPNPSPTLKLSIDFYNATTTTICTSSNCGPRNGFCIDLNTCQCQIGYANFETEESPAGQYCTYQQKSQLVAFLLEFFFPIGVGHLYAGRIVNGLIKMGFNVLLPCLLCCLLAGCTVSSGGNY